MKKGNWIVLIFLCFALFTADLFLGSVLISPVKILKSLIDPPLNPGIYDIFVNFRFPRAITAFFAGASLAVCGLYVQTLFGNPLAGPSVLGIGAGAGLGVAFLLLFLPGRDWFLKGFGFKGELAVALAAWTGAFLVMMFILLLFSRKNFSTTGLLLAGIMTGYITNAVIVILLHFGAPALVQTYLNWSFGSFSDCTWNQLGIFVPVLSAGLLLSFFPVKNLNALLLGGNFAGSVGLAIRRTRIVLVLIATLLAGTVTAFCGPVGFIGIAVPHLARYMFKTADHRTLVPACILLGGINTMAADILASVPGQGIILPINALTALFGAPVLILIITGRAGRSPE